MPNYFKYFPSTVYKKYNITDISKKVNFVDEQLKNAVLMLPYTVKDGERAEDIAYYYYGTMDYFWIILMANNIQNYYEDWPMSSDNFDRYLISKYAKTSGKNGYDVISWTMNEKILDNVLYYYDGDGNVISVDTIVIESVPKQYWELRKTPEGQRFLIENFISTNIGVKPLRIYDYEFQNNENKRNIVIVNKDYVDEVITQFKKSIK